MAELVTGVLLEAAVSKLSEAIIHAINQARHFQPKLTEMQSTIERITPVFKDMEELNKQLDRRQEETKRFVKLLKEAQDLVQKCNKVTRLSLKMSAYASKLDEMNSLLRDFVQFDLQLVMARNVVETLAEVKGKGTSSGVPLQKCDAIGFDDGLKDLKSMLFKDSVVVVSAAGGCGKTTLVTKLCHDPDITAKFGRIYFVTVSRAYNKKVIVRNLLGELPGTSDDEAAIQQWGSFLGTQTSEILLVLDDVWSETVITDFKFNSPKYKILVTSRMTFNQFTTYHLPNLSDEHATRLFRESAFSKNGNEQKYGLVRKLVKCCKNHPLVLSVVGRLLNGTDVGNWEFMLEKLMEEKESVLDLHEEILYCLEKSLHFFLRKPDMKQCYLDLGLFPEDQEIAAAALKDMWVHLYKHDDKGLTTTKTLTDLSSRSLATLSPVRKYLLSYCEEGSVKQHDMTRELAIHLSSREPIEDRERLILYGQYIPEFPQTINARILSISTGESIPLSWNEIRAPKVELLVLNFMSNMHPLPQFIQNMESLKVLMITNYGYDFSEIQNFPAPQYLTRLTKIRLDHVSISSISTTILMLENLQKLSLIMCKIGNSFNEGIAIKLTSLSEIDISSCDDLFTFPALLCNAINLKKLSITNCHWLTSISEEFGNLSNLEVVRLTFARSSQCYLNPRDTSRN